MERLKDVVDKKKEKSANTKPKYGMRKLSVGLVPVFLGAIVLIPGVGYAKEVSVGATSAPRTEIVGEVLSRRDDKKDEEYAIQKVEAVSNQEGLEATSTSRSSANIVEENESINKNSKENDKEIVKVLNEDKFTVENKEEKSESKDTNTQDGEKSAVNEDLQTSEEKIPEGQQTGQNSEAVEDGTQTEGDKNLQKADDPNYDEDEKNIKDYSGSERYRETDLQPGDTNQESPVTDQGEVKDGLEFNIKNPSKTSPSKTEYGYQITIDKKTGQRTYTKIYVTDSGNLPVDKGNKKMMSEGDKLTPESPDVTYKPNENTGIAASRSQRNLNYEASEETLKHINNKDNSSTSFGMKDNYTQDNPRVKFFGGNFALGYKVNPWPNENDKLELMKLSGEYNEKVFVQGQDIDTGVKVDNIDANAKDRLVGQVYNPITGAIVPGASAYIGDNGNIHIKMPEGALKKDENGKTVVNEDSIFNTPDYKALQNLDVKFFVRPRTAEEFKTIAEIPDEFGEKGTYTGSEAGTADINHKGKNVTIDKQGIDRYDHYNLVGGFKLNLDDTRYYNQSFEDEDGKATEGRTYLNVNPGEDFTVQMFTPANPSKNDKTADEMNEADKNGEAAGRIIMDFINRENKGKAEEDQWKLEVDAHDISKFTVKPPKSAKAGDFIAVPVEYTYTNGSKDLHYFHFVVKESTYIKPEYDAQVNYPVNEQTSEATVPQDTKRIKPNHYTLPDTLETDEAGNKLATDDKGNKWTVKVDETTGKVTAKPVDPKAFDGGEKLTVPVIAHYADEQKPGKDITEEANAYFVIEEKANMTARYNAKAGKSGDKLSSDVILNTEDKYNRRPGKYTLDSPTYTDDKGNTWNVTIDETSGKVTATVPNAEEGKSIDGALLNVPVTAHYYEEDAEGNKVEAGTKKTEVQFVASGTKGKHTYTEELPFEVEVRKDPRLKKGEWKYATDDKGNELRGEKGEQEVTLTIENSEVTDTSAPKVIKKARNAVVLVGEGTNYGTHEIKEKKELPFETKYVYDENLEAGQREETGGEPGEQERTNTLVIKDGKVTENKEGEFKTTKDPVDKVIKIGIKPIVKEVEKPFETEYIYDENEEMGKEEEVTPGENGKVTITTSYDKDQKKLVTNKVTKDPVKRVVKVGIKPVMKEEPIPHETEYKHNPELKAGEVKKIKEGTPGKVTVTTTFNKETGKLETKVERTEPTKAVYEYGSKTTGEVKVKSNIPFEVEIIEDNTMDAGTHKVEQEGENGEKETTIVIENSKEIEDKRKEEITKKPVKKIIKVGTKPNDKMCPAPVEPEKPEDNKPGKSSEENFGGENHNKPNENVNPGEQSDNNKPNKKDNNSSNSENKEPGNAEQDKSDKESEQEKSSETKSNPSGASSDKLEKSSEDEKSPEELGEYYVSKNKDSETIKGKKAKSNTNINDYAKAPKTYDAGIDGYAGIAGLAASALAFLQRRKKEDEK
ncbi:adhesin domain containing protein [Peptoniphilus sp. BV3AC2]|uniref:adhesin domain containing protein n=1 Tax=Peptoniphilus sp. BV3AC2 TaxID=1111133 RepID=UPI0003B8F85B|nr:adhesin domain containing protein [Peptoniphilus sp. BV3AC2]ERT64879.1 G5 domain protein [Peptoniphilus sp. BV3AC2]